MEWDTGAPYLPQEIRGRKWKPLLAHFVYKNGRGADTLQNQEEIEQSVRLWLVWAKLSVRSARIKFAGAVLLSKLIVI